MCGIFCLFEEYFLNNHELLKTYETCKRQLMKRGPNFNCCKTVTHNNYSFVFAASVLWLQNKEVIKQPIENNKSVFVYNGNLYYEHVKLYSNSNDTQALLDSLDLSEDIYSTLGKVQGPFAFIYLNKETSRLYFCRDLYGRRSLLIGRQNNKILLTSVACKSIQFHCLELPAIGIFCYNLQTKSLELIPWKFRHNDFTSKIGELEKLLNLKINLIDTNNASTFINYYPPSENDLSLYKQLTDIPFYSALEILLENKLWKSKVSQLNELLFEAVQKRVLAQPQACENCLETPNICNHALTGILFSGGVDCTILALIADQFVKKGSPIDLMNVSFKDNAPDRLTALESLEELQILRPNRKWNLIEINISEDELKKERREQIADLIYPRCTILDESLGCAMWFASRGQNENYRSPCRVLLVGSGADELFGGYTKHRAALKSESWNGLHESLVLDWQNISHRNLARDDRVVSDHGRQLCMPYLDENVVQYVRSLNCWEKTCPTKELPHGLGEKILLRSLAFHLGLRKAAYKKKRALQFGSRIANSKENASDISPRL